MVTGTALAEKFAQAAGRNLVYRRFPDEVLASSPLLAALARLVDADQLTVGFVYALRHAGALRSGAP